MNKQKQKQAKQKEQQQQQNNCVESEDDLCKNVTY